MAKNENGGVPGNGGPRDDRMAAPPTPHDAAFRDNEFMGDQTVPTPRDAAYDLIDLERRRKLRELWDERILPSLPDSSEFHRCWVSTTHPVDTPQRRRRFGYRFVPMDDVRAQGWAADNAAVKDGQFAGCVMWRELVAMEIPMQTFIDYMTIYHFDMPQEAQRGIVDNLDDLDERLRGKGGRVDLEPAMEELRRRINAPPGPMFRG